MYGAKVMIAETILAGWMLAHVGEDVNTQTGELLQCSALSNESDLQSCRDSAVQRNEETVRYCMKQETEGVTAPSGFVCTGAYNPYWLRSGKSIDEPLIQKILSDN